MTRERWYKLPQEAADAVAANGIARLVQGVDQDGATQDHVMWLNRQGIVQSTLASDWKGQPPLSKLLRWEQ